jgi:hypothetical protein
MRNITAAVATTLALTLAGCAGEMNRDRDTSGVVGDVGEVEARLTLPEGYTINSVHFVVSREGATVRDGDIDVTNSSVLRFRIGNLPIANGYTLTLSATTAGAPSTACGGSAGFDISSAGVAGLTMTLTCGGGVTIDTDPNGDISVDVGVVQGPGTICPVVSGISALPLETAVGSSLALTGYASSAVDSQMWTGTGGTFGTASAAATSFTCGTAGLHTLTFAITKAGCTNNSTQTVEVQCTGAGDAGTPDTGAPDTGAPDTGAPDTGAPDTGAPDTGAPDTGTPDAGPDGGFWANTCLPCLNANCQDFNTIPLSGVCFNNATAGLNGDPVAQPNTTQRCTDAVQCSITATTGCAEDVAGPARCYCGEQTLNQCQATGPLPAAPCITAWERVTECDTETNAAARNTCVLGQFQDLTRPAGYAFFTVECANANCQAACQLTP